MPPQYFNFTLMAANFTFNGNSSGRGAGISIIAGADIHIFVFTDCKNNRFQKKLIGQNTNI